MSAPRGYATALLVILATTSLVALMVNTTVNPFRVTPMPWTSEKMEPYRDLTSQARTGKAGIVRSAEAIGGAIFGSSRVANGMDPEFEGWGRDDVVNLGCVGGFFYEAEGLCRYVMERQPVETVLFGIDPGDLSSEIDTRSMSDYYGSPMGEGRDRLDRELRYLVGISSLEASIETLKRAVTGARTEYTPKGLHVRVKKERKKGQRHFIRKHIAGDAAFDLPDLGRLGVGLNPDKMMRLEGLMREVRSRGIAMTLFFHPQHALLHARAADVADTPVLFEKERREITLLVARINGEEHPGPPIAFWDFYDSHPLNGDPIPDDLTMMPHWGDLGHYSLEVGNLMQARMLGVDLPGVLEGEESFGTLVTPENLESHLTRVRDGYLGYLTGPGREDVAWKKEVTDESKAE